jgi:hypothetical protein
MACVYFSRPSVRFLRLHSRDAANKAHHYLGCHFGPGIRDLRSSCSSQPQGATAQCRDGSYSFSRSRSGTCSQQLTGRLLKQKCCTRKPNGRVLRVTRRAQYRDFAALGVSLLALLGGPYNTRNLDRSSKATPLLLCERVLGSVAASAASSNPTSVAEKPRRKMDRASDVIKRSQVAEAALPIPNLLVGVGTTNFTGLRSRHSHGINFAQNALHTGF